MRTFVAAASLGLTLSFAPLPAPAAVIYEETSSADDLPIDPPYPVLPLALGTSSVLGRTSFSGDAVDSFAVSVPAGLELASVTYVFTISAFARGGATLTTAVSGLSFVAGDGSAPQPGSLLANENVDMVPGLCSVFVTPPCGPESASAVSVALFEGALPRGPGIYSVEQRALSVNDPELVTWSSDYRIDLVVVPEPASLLLAGVGVALLSFGRGRQRTRRVATAVLGLVVVLGLPARSEALVYEITPVSLPAIGVSFTGTVTTDGTIGALAPANVVDWSIAVAGPISFTITPANSELNDTVFRLATASADEIVVAFPDGNFQFNLLGPFTSTVPACANCDEGAVQLFRSDLGRNTQGFALQDFTDGDPDWSDFEGPVVTGGATSYLAATIVPEPASALLAGLGLAGLARAGRGRRRLIRRSPAAR